MLNKTSLFPRPPAGAQRNPKHTPPLFKCVMSSGLLRSRACQAGNPRLYKGGSVCSLSGAAWLLSWAEDRLRV